MPKRPVCLFTLRPSRQSTQVSLRGVQPQVNPLAAMKFTLLRLTRNDQAGLNSLSGGLWPPSHACQVLGFAYPEYLCPAGRACALRRRTLVFQDNLPRALDLDLFPTLHAVSLSHCSSSFRFLPVFTSGVLFHWVHCLHHRPQFVTCQEGVSTICHFFENFPMDWGKVHFHPRVCHSVARPTAIARNQSKDRRNP